MDLCQYITVILLWISQANFAGPRRFEIMGQSLYFTSFGALVVYAVDLMYLSAKAEVLPVLGNIALLLEVQFYDRHVCKSSFIPIRLITK